MSYGRENKPQRQVRGTEVGCLRPNNSDKGGKDRGTAMRIDTPQIVGKRLRDALAVRQMTQGELANQIGFSRVYINKLVNGALPEFKSDSNLISIANALGISPEWLIRGSGQMMTERLAYDTKGEVFELNSSIPVNVFEATAAQDPMSQPVLTKTDEVVFLPQSIIKAGVESNELKAFAVIGSNMAPTLLEGDLAIVDCAQRSYIDGRIYAFFFGDHVRLRRVRIDADECLTLISDRDPPSMIPERLSSDRQAKLHVIGEVIARMGGL